MESYRRVVEEIISKLLPARFMSEEEKAQLVERAVARTFRVH